VLFCLKLYSFPQVEAGGGLLFGDWLGISRLVVSSCFHFHGLGFFSWVLFSILFVVLVGFFIDNVFFKKFFLIIKLFLSQPVSLFLIFTLPILPLTVSE